MAAAAAIVAVAVLRASAQQAPRGGGLRVDVPAAVRATVNREIGTSRIAEIRAEIDKNNPDDPPEYVLSVTLLDHPYTLRVASDGTLIALDAQDETPDPVKVKFDDLPEPARATFRRTTANQPAEIEILRQDFQQVYELHTSINGLRYDIRIDNTGRLLSKEIDDSEPPKDKPRA